MFPTTAVVVILGFLPLHVVPEVEPQAGIYRPMCNHQWKLKPTSYGHTKKSQDMEYEPTLLRGTDKMIPIYAYHKPFKVQLPNKHEQQNGFNSDNMKAWSGIQMGPKPMKVLVLQCTNGAQKGACFSHGLHSMVFLAEIYAIKACIMENIEKGWRGRNIYILSDSRMAIKALNNFQINYKTVWDCHQYLVKLAEHNRDHLI